MSMTGRYATEVREQIRAATDIVQLVGERVALRRAGRAFKGLCPFHAEKTPSFTVNPEREMWHCFGCNRGGDAFAFVMEMDRLTFPEALEALADRAGIELPTPERSERDDALDRIYQANGLAAEYFQASLKTPAGEGARAYLEGRGFAGEVLDRYQVGWAPEGWEGLTSSLSKLLPVRVLEDAGLSMRRGDGSGHYDRFRNRIMFPVWAGPGRIAGFGARALREEDSPKYINSPETPAFRKGSLLFGLTQARRAIRERRQALVVEGYLDAMRLAASGMEHVVSTCGTALTAEQARMLARLDAEAVLVYDGDDAGIRAADRALEPLLEAGLSVRVLVLPAGEDPDSFVRKEGADALRQRLESAGDVPAFLAESRLRQSDAANPPAEARARRLVELLARVGDPIRRRLLLRRGAEAFGIEETVLLEALERRKTPGRARAGRAAAEARGAGAAPQGGAGVGALQAGSGISEASTLEPLDPIDREIAGRALTEEGALAALVERGGERCVRGEALRALLRPWLELGRPPLPDELSGLTSESALARAVLAELPTEDGRTLELSRRAEHELIDRAEERRLRASIHVLDQAIRDAEKSRDEGSLGRLVAERRDLATKLHARSHSAIG
jgi:DNA primase